MSFVERSGEQVARLFDRRTFLKRSAQVIFSMATATALHIGQVEQALATYFGYCPYNAQSHECQCHPSHGIYCHTFNAKYCTGHTCSGGCVVNTSYYKHTNGCWCTRQCDHGTSSIYYVCCDCTCPGHKHCSCSYAYNTLKNTENPQNLQHELEH